MTPKQIYAIAVAIKNTINQYEHNRDVRADERDWESVSFWNNEIAELKDAFSVLEPLMYSSADRLA